MAFVRCSSRVISANKAVSTADIAPEPWILLPKIIPSILVEYPAINEPIIKSNSPK